MALTHSHYLRYRRGGSVYTKYGNTTKQTTPSIAFRAGGKTYYIPLAQATPNASYPIGVRYNNKVYRATNASVTVSGAVSASQGRLVFVSNLSLSNGGFDQSWKISCIAYLSNKNEVPSNFITYSPQTYSASTTSVSSTILLATASVPIAYVKIRITVFNTTYTTDFLDVQYTPFVTLSLSVT